MAANTLALTVEDCRAQLAALSARVEDHFGVSSQEATWAHVAQADDVLYHLRRAAEKAGIGGEP